MTIIWNLGSLLYGTQICHITPLLYSTPVMLYSSAIKNAVWERTGAIYQVVHKICHVVYTTGSQWKV